MKYKRWLSSRMSAALHSRRVIMLVGPRQSGKTTLVQMLGADVADYHTLDDLVLLEAAKSDPQTFIKRNKKLMIIDEVQRVPELLLAIKKAVDEDTSVGQYILTGSADIQKLPSVMESLAGRVTKLRLRPLARGEINQKKADFLQNAFDLQFNIPNEHYGRDNVIKIALEGGFPEPLRLKGKEKNLWYRDYIESLLDYDVKEVVNIRRKESMRNLLEVLAAWSSKYIDFSAIGSSLAIQRPTLESYINVLEAFFLLDRLPAWTKTDYSRVGKRAKLYMGDSGMMAAILKWMPEQIRLDGDKVGKLVETFIFNELSANIDCQTDYQLYHYRDREKREIDFLIERDDGALLGIEVKAGASVKREHFNHLQWFNNNLVKSGHPFIGLILYTGDKAIPFGNNLWAVPMSCLFG